MSAIVCFCFSVSIFFCFSASAFFFFSALAFSCFSASACFCSSVAAGEAGGAAAARPGKIRAWASNDWRSRTGSVIREGLKTIEGSINRPPESPRARRPVQATRSRPGPARGPVRPRQRRARRKEGRAADPAGLHSARSTRGWDDRFQSRGFGQPRKRMSLPSGREGGGHQIYEIFGPRWRREGLEKRPWLRWYSHGGRGANLPLLPAGGGRRRGGGGWKKRAGWQLC